MEAVCGSSRRCVTDDGPHCKHEGIDSGSFKQRGRIDSGSIPETAAYDTCDDNESLLEWNIAEPN